MKRLVSAIVYVILVVGSFLLREFVDYRLFNILIFAFASIGACEMAIATKGIVSKVVSVCTVIFGILLVPVFFVGEMIVNGYGWLFAVGLMIISLAVNLIVYFKGEKQKDRLLFTFINALYPSVFILLMTLCNGLPQARGFIALLLLFVVSACADVLAYYVGMLLKGPKLCPTLSPKKTWAGAIGGLFGGAIGSLLIYFVFAKSLGILNWWLFLIIGVVGAILSIFGDLFESFLKRRIGIKDIGNIMPGHGGVLDRIDGLSFITLFVYPLMLLL